MTDAIKSKRYDMVAIVDPIPSEYYSRDTARTMPYEDALTIHAITVRIYAEWGYTPAHVPFMEVAERQNYLASLIR
jgi:predicted ATPase